MIAIPRGLGSLGLPVVSAGTPATAPAAGAAAPGAFDAAFADLTSALLATAAGAGQLAPAAGKGAAAAAEVPVEASDADTDDASAGPVTVPVVLPVPTPIAFVPFAPAVGTTGDTVSDAAIADAAPLEAVVANGGAAVAGGASISSEIVGEDDATTEGWVDESFGRETRDEAFGDAGPIHTPIDPIPPDGLRRQVVSMPSPAAMPPAVSAPAKARALASAGANESPAIAAGPTETEAAPVNGATEAPAPAETPSRPALNGLARRAEALQRALGRRADAEHGETAPAGLVAQIARGGQAIAVETASTGQGTPDGGDTAQQMRRAARMAAVAPAAAPAPAAVTAGTPRAPRGGHDAAEAVTPNWRAAAAAARFAEPGSAPIETARTAPSVPVAAANVVAGELPVLRDLRPAVIETAARLPQEAATAEHVQMQIVKSMRLQWTGGTGEARVALKPEYLGEVVANIKVEQGVVTATLHADTPEVRRLLETQTASLREALVEHGLKLDKVVIAEPETPSGQPGDRRSRGRQPQPQSSRPRRRAREGGDGATFELSTE